MRNRTITQSLLTLICRLVQSGRANGHEQRLCRFFLEFMEQLNKQVELGRSATDSDYLEFQRTVSANIKGGPVIRQRVLLRKLLAADPAFIEMFDPATVLESGLKASVASDSRQIVNLIGQSNEQYSSQHGKDLGGYLLDSGVLK